MNRSAPQNDLRTRLRELRKAKGWTQQELARAVGVSRQSINSIERGRYTPSLPLALRFARLFGCAMATNLGSAQALS